MYEKVQKSRDKSSSTSSQLQSQTSFGPSSFSVPPKREKAQKSQSKGSYSIPAPRYIGANAMPIQAKLKIGEPGDKYEQEADRVAAQVVNQINAPVTQQSSQNLQREEMSDEENALAYTQGTEIHVAPGQEQHLPHEAWHVVQQRQGRVNATIQDKGISINNDGDLEREADVMGTKALQMKRTLLGETGSTLPVPLFTQSVLPAADVVQRINGATPTNWFTRNITTQGNSIRHEVGWESSTGNIDDLNDVLTREEVTWAGPCPWSLEPAYQTAGQHHGMGTSRGNTGHNTDTHEVVRPYFDVENPPLKRGQTMNFVMNQVYQYSPDGGSTWHNIPNSEYTLTRTLYRRKLGKEPIRKEFSCTLTKQGRNDPAQHKLTVKL